MAEARAEERAVGLERDDGSKLFGSMTVEFWDHSGNVVPEVSFNPVGRIQPATIDKHLPVIYLSIAQAQTKERGNAR